MDAHFFSVMDHFFIAAIYFQNGDDDPRFFDFLYMEIHKNLGNRMKPGVPAHGASRFTTQLPLLQDRTGLDMPAQPGAKSAVQDSHTAVSFYSRRASRGSVVKPPWNTGPNAAREDMPRKGLNKAEERRGVFPPAPRRVWGAGRRPAGKFRVAVRPALFKGRRGPTAR